MDASGAKEVRPKHLIILLENMMVKLLNGLLGNMMVKLLVSKMFIMMA